MLQMRGTCLSLWADVLPMPNEQTWLATLRQIATTLARHGGTVHI
jgi:hypothetical protein